MLFLNCLMTFATADCIQINANVRRWMAGVPTGYVLCRTNVNGVEKHRDYSKIRNRGVLHRFTFAKIAACHFDLQSHSALHSHAHTNTHTCRSTFSLTVVIIIGSELEDRRVDVSSNELQMKCE